MAHRSHGSAQETFTTTGTGNVTVAGAVAGSETLAAAGLTNNDTFFGRCEAVDGSGVPTGDFEEALYTWTTGGVIVRTAILKSSNADGAVNWAAGTKRIYIIRPALDSAGMDASPAQLTANQDNWNVLGAEVTVVRFSTDAPREITGLANGYPNRRAYLHNIGGSTATLKDESGSSTAANRFALTADLVIHPDVVVPLQYDGTSQRWRSLVPSSQTINDLTEETAVQAADLVPLWDASASTTDKAQVGAILNAAPTVPTIVSVGASFSSTGVPTATLPGTHAANDILVLCIQQSNQADYAAPSGYTRLGPQNGIGTAAQAGATKLAIFWKRDNGSEVAPTLTDSGDHTFGVMFAVRGCPTTGDPFRMIGQSFKFVASTTGTADIGTTRTPGSLIVNIFAHAIDSAAAQGSSPTNASLTNVTEDFDGSTADGTGGGIYIMSGVAALPGEIAASTVTWGSSTVDVSTTLAFVPKDAAPIPRGPETVTYIGSPTDLDDQWVKPYGARRVFAQICDGGGGGSGGNTTTTAAGGGGGGGGGYAEAWYDAEDLAASVTVHAGRGGAAGTALNQAGNLGVVSEFGKGDNFGPLIGARRSAGVAATAAASADGGNGGCGAGKGTSAVETARLTLSSLDTGTAFGGRGAAGGSGTTAPTGGSEADMGGGGGESGADTDAGITTGNNGNSICGGGGGSGGRTNTNISFPGHGGGAAATAAAQGATGAQSTRMPYGGAGGVGGGSSVVTGGTGGFPGGGGGGGAGVAGGFGGAGGHGCVVVTTYF